MRDESARDRASVRAGIAAKFADRNPLPLTRPVAGSPSCLRVLQNNVQFRFRGTAGLRG